MAAAHEHPGILLHAVKNRPLAYGALLRIFERWREQAGIATPFSAHSFRRTTATHAVRAGADRFSLAAKMGWADLQMARGCTFRTPAWTSPRCTQSTHHRMDSG